jgi:23S rRNA (cytosine1962-C5)-methyltransferase
MKLNQPPLFRTCDDEEMKNALAERPPRIGPAQPFGPAASITRRAADRLRAGHLWVYRSDIEELTPAPNETQLPPGALLSVMDSRGIPLGSGLYSDASQIALRMVSDAPALTRDAYLADLRTRVLAALALRDQLAPVNAENNACRLLFSEADQLPGIVADRYNDLIVLQLLTQGTAQDDLRSVLTFTLAANLPIQTVAERPDPRVRELEHLPAPAPGPLFARTPDAPKLATVFTINGLNFHFDAEAGQKTGAFLDQRLNYAAAARYASGSAGTRGRAGASGRALDVCTYQGGFALHLAQVCERVTGVDASRSALEVADRNLQLNPGLAAQTDWIEADAFELLREFEHAGERFDTIVLDPPAFAKTKRAAEGAMRGYKELNLRAMKMLRPGGTLVTCSCSHHVSPQEFMDAIAAAASDAKRRVQVLEARGAAPDHPSILTLPETNYLKCVICRVS